MRPFWDHFWPKDFKNCTENSQGVMEKWKTKIKIFSKIFQTPQECILGIIKPLQPSKNEFFWKIGFSGFPWVSDRPKKFMKKKTNVDKCAKLPNFWTSKDHISAPSSPISIILFSKETSNSLVPQKKMLWSERSYTDLYKLSCEKKNVDKVKTTLENLPHMELHSEFLPISALQP